MERIKLVEKFFVKKFDWQWFFGSFFWALVTLCGIFVIFVMPGVSFIPTKIMQTKIIHLNLFTGLLICLIVSAIIAEKKGKYIEVEKCQMLRKSKNG